MTVAVFLLGLLLAVFGATAGAALVAVGRSELTRAASRQLRGGTGSPVWLGQIEQYLATASATTSFGVILLGAALPAMFTGLQPLMIALVAAGAGVPFVLFSGYLVPRWLARPRAEAIAGRVVPILRPWARFVGLFLPAPAATGTADVRSLWRERAAAGLAADEELLMVGGIMTFSQRPVREMMTPRTEVVAVPEDASLKDIAAVFAQSGYSRIPVYRGTLDEIIGMLHAFDLFKLAAGDPLPIRPVAAAPASRSCGDLLLDMQRERRHLAVVLDEFGGTMGIVTMEDLLEELVGEIFDEHDTAAGPGVASPVVVEIDGAVAPEAVEERFGVLLPGGKAATIGGRLAELAGRIPAAGERLLLQGLEFDIMQASPTRIERVVIRPAPAPTTSLDRGAA